MVAGVVGRVASNIPLRPEWRLADPSRSEGHTFVDFGDDAMTEGRAHPMIDDTLGWILLAQGEADRAVSYLSAANVFAPSNPDIQYHLAVALHRVGRAADAKATLEALLGSGVAFSDRAEAEKLLQELTRG